MNKNNCTQIICALYFKNFHLLLRHARSLIAQMKCASHPYNTNMTISQLLLHRLTRYCHATNQAFRSIGGQTNYPNFRKKVLRYIVYGKRKASHVQVTKTLRDYESELSIVRPLNQLKDDPFNRAGIDSIVSLLQKIPPSFGSRRDIFTIPINLIYIVLSMEFPPRLALLSPSNHIL